MTFYIAMERDGAMFEDDAMSRALGNHVLRIHGKLQTVKDQRMSRGIFSLALRFDTNLKLEPVQHMPEITVNKPYRRPYRLKKSVISTSLRPQL